MLKKFYELYHVTILRSEFSVFFPARRFLVATVLTELLIQLFLRYFSHLLLLWHFKTKASFGSPIIKITCAQIWNLSAQQLRKTCFCHRLWIFHSIVNENIGMEDDELMLGYKSYSCEWQLPLSFFSLLSDRSQKRGGHHAKENRHLLTATLAFPVPEINLTLLKTSWLMQWNPGWS